MGFSAWCFSNLSKYHISEQGVIHKIRSVGAGEGQPERDGGVTRGGGGQSHRDVTVGFKNEMEK